jgi:alpha-D-ribose 1-methylphosphonate 5-triphosphate diphosphatase
MSMPKSFVIANARLVLADRMVDQGWLAVVDGRIAELGEGKAPESGLDFAGDLLLPGLIELHTDHLESHYTPRPKVRWNPLAAVMSYDAQMAAAGITTVFDSLRVGSDFDHHSPKDDIWKLALALETGRRSGRLRAEHRTHLRCEISSTDVLDQLRAYDELYPIHLMSLMDHTPGQRQFRDIDIWKVYYTGKTGRSQAEADALIEHRLALHGANAAKHRRELVSFAKERTIPLASHDDATSEHVEEAMADGVSIAEFPTTIEAARHSHEAGIAVMMGGPNVVRGGSHSGNVAAEALAQDGVLDLLSSDYIPSSLLLGAFDLARRLPAVDLPAAVRLVTLNPAKAVGLQDRGELAPDRRADMVRVSLVDDQPVPLQVFRAGERVA